MPTLTGCTHKTLHNYKLSCQFTARAQEIRHYTRKSQFIEAHFNIIYLPQKFLIYASFPCAKQVHFSSCSLKSHYRPSHLPLRQSSFLIHTSIYATFSYVKQCQFLFTAIDVTLPSSLVIILPYTHINKLSTTQFPPTPSHILYLESCSPHHQ